MADGKKPSHEQDSGRGLRRFNLFSSSSNDPGSPTQSTQQMNTLLMPRTDAQHMRGHLESPRIPPAAPKSPNVRSYDAAPQNPPLASILSPTAQQNTKRERWTELKTFASMLSKGFDSFGPLKQAVEGIMAGIETFETAAQNRAEYEILRNDLNGLFHDLAEFFDGSTPPVMAPTIVNFARGIDRELEIVRRKLSETRIGAHQTDPDGVLEHYRRIQALLQRLTSNVGFKTLRIADEQATEARLKSLPHSPAAKYSSAESSDLRTRCIQNTRVYVLEELYEWACDYESPKIYWLNGMAGTGKTTIAYSFCEQLDRSKKLAASFFCSRQLLSCRDVNRIVPTISYQLSRFSRPFRSAISRVLEENPEVHNQVLLDQFKDLILQPFDGAKNTLPTDLVVVIDALDECENNGGVDRMLGALLSCVQELPVKFFVASRPDAMILDRMRGRHGENITTELRLHELDRPTVQKDIKTYLAMKLIPHMNLPAANLDVLTKRSGVLFIYASTVARYLECDNFFRADDRLEAILKAPKDASDGIERGINDLYAAILHGAFNNSDLTRLDQDEMKLVLNTVVCAKEPLSIDAMAGLLGLGARKVRAALRSLFSVLHLSDTAHTVTTLHESFPDYLLDRTRSEAFHCDTSKHNAELARLCFEQINAPNPPFNICNLESSYVLDADVRDLPTRIEKAIPRQLLYACRYWIAHCMLAEKSKDLATMLREFASERFLLWMEVVNLGGYLQESTEALHTVQKWSLSVEYLEEGTRKLLQDMCEFATSFSLSAARLSTPHLYVSMLTFWRGQSPIAKHYGPQRVRLITEQSTAMSTRTFALLAILHPGEVARSVAYSPDGAHIISSSSRGIVRIWDAHTGQPVGQPLEGHCGSVTCVTYSPDGTCIASGSDDRTVRIWDAHTGQLIRQPLEGHTSPATCVAYSPDGAYITSSSSDGTILTWDALTGQPEGEPLKGHNKFVSSVMYSPNSAYIISGSYDNTICIWDAQTSRLVGQPLKGHSNRVLAVAYSPDGKYIVSGSDDITIRIWDEHTSQPVGQPLRGHLGAVKSVAYSPDGACIISGFDDCTIQIWNAYTGQPIGEPLEGHTNLVNSVAYSPDGAYILSSSWDATIRIWDAHAGQPVRQSLGGHDSSINALAYSPDGAHIVSTSLDHVICSWSVQTGQLDQPRVYQSAKSALSVAYSPDGAYFVSGSLGGTIEIWDTKTGQSDKLPEEWCAQAVNSVAYSPDGAFIVSGSDNWTIRIWDAHTSQPVGQPLRGHKKRVISVAYSPDGAYVVSGSADCTVRIWNAYTGQPVGKPLKGHTSRINSVAYSPDGAYIVSGSNDKTIRVWDTYSGQLVGQPWRGHTSYVNSVAYSPDGVYIVSGSTDTTVRIWDAHTGQSVGQPLEGHTEFVISVVYSPDGAYIASGSGDRTIRIWDTHAGQLLGQSPKSRTDSVNSAAYSPDSAYSTSAFPDQTVRTQDTQSVMASGVLGSSHNSLNSQTAPPSHVALKAQFAEPRVSCNLGCQIDCPHMAWTLHEDGWIVFNQDKLVWVPPDLRGSLLRPQNTCLISGRGFLQLDLDRSKLGENWHEFSQPERSTQQ